MVRARPVSDDLPLGHLLSLGHYRFLVDTGVLVRALELRQLINVAANFARQLAGVMLALDAYDDALGVNGIDDAVAPGENHCARIARSDAFHSRANYRSFGTEQRNRLALHVRAHQRAVCVVVLEEWHE